MLLDTELLYSNSISSRLPLWSEISIFLRYSQLFAQNDQPVIPGRDRGGWQDTEPDSRLKKRQRRADIFC